MLTRSVRTQIFKTQVSPVAGRSNRKSHMVYIDNLRTTLITFVIIVHMAITYGAKGGWYYHEPGSLSIAMSVIVVFISAVGSAFVLGLFFLLAGYFTPHSYDKRGFSNFIANRAKRLLIPLALYEIFIFPLIRFNVRVNDGFQGTLWDHLVEHFTELNTIADGPVWFLLTLMIVGCGYALWRLVINPDLSQQAGTPGNGAIVFFAFCLGLVTFLVRLWFKVGIFYEPLHQEFAHYPQYISMFVIGTVACRRDWLIKFPDSQARQWSWIALACILTIPVIAIAAGALSGQLDERGAGGWNWISFAYSIWEGFTCVAMTILTFAWFRKRFDRQSWLAAKMADATFTAYVIHPAIIVPLAILLSGISISLDLKFIIVTPIAVVLTYVISYYFQGLPLVRNIL